jgi:hypothetical protein
MPSFCLYLYIQNINIVMDQQQVATKPSFPTEFVELPSKGVLYPKDSPLSSGKIEMKYMTAKEEDILTNQNYIRQGIVLDKLLESLIVSKINYDDLLIGDKNAVFIASRVLGYGKDYSFNYTSPVTGETEQITVDLTKLEEKDLDSTSLVTPGINEFAFTLPHTETKVTFKLLTHGDEKAIDKEIEGLKKINSNLSYDVTTRLKFIITSVEGDRSKGTIRNFVDNSLMARDSKALRDYIGKISPDIKLTFDYSSNGYTKEGIPLPIDISFFYPND